MRLGLKIAGRFLKSNIGQTILIIVGIAIGVSVQIFIGLLIQGLQSSLIDKTIGESSQITITSDVGQEIKDYQEIVERVSEADKRISVTSVASDHSAFLEYNNVSNSILIRGFEFEQANQIYGFEQALTEGVLPKEENEIALGIGIQNEYDLQLGDKVELITNNKETITVSVAGFFDMKVSSINNTWAITTLSKAQEIFGLGDSVTSIEMQVSNDSVFSADVIAGIIAESIDDSDLVVENWKDANEQLLSGLQGQSVSSIMIQVFVMISVVLGIASVLAITVLQKSRQIGILKAMGLKNSITSLVFVFEGLILGVLGASLGILSGLGLGYAFTKFAVNADGSPIVDLYINVRFIVGSGVIAVAASVIAAFIPAIRSFKLNPIDIIRNN